eukprot:6369164-Alexandrium_andersonii.AAC.1
MRGAEPAAERAPAPPRRCRRSGSVLPCGESRHGPRPWHPRRSKTPRRTTNSSPCACWEAGAAPSSRPCGAHLQ